MSTIIISSEYTIQNQIGQQNTQIINNYQISLSGYYIDIFSDYNIQKPLIEYYIDIFSNYKIQITHVLNLLSNYYVNTKLISLISPVSYYIQSFNNLKSNYYILNSKKILSIYNIQINNYIALKYYIKIINQINIKFDYYIANINNILTQYYLINNNICLFNYYIQNKNYITVDYYSLNKLNILSSYNIYLNYLSNIISKYEIGDKPKILYKYYILTQKQKYIKSIFNIQQNIAFPIMLSLDKYGYNANIAGLYITINYNDEQYNLVMNNNPITINVPQYNVNSNYISQPYKGTSMLSNIISQIVIDNYNNQTQLYQEPSNVNLQNYNSNRFQIIINNLNTFIFKTNFKFSTNSKACPYHIYLFQPTVLYINASDFTGFANLNKLVKTLYIIQPYPILNNNINISIEDSNILLQKTYPIISSNYQPPSNILIYTPDEIIFNNYIDPITNLLSIPFKLIINKSNNLLTNKPISIPIDIYLTNATIPINNSNLPITYNNIKQIIFSYIINTWSEQI